MQKLRQSVGLGSPTNDYERCVEIVRTAIELGYRHLDTAQAYGTEAAFGEAIEMADVDREDLLVATKLWGDDLASEAVHTKIGDSLDRLGVETIDLLYVHWPSGDYDPVDTLSAFQELYEQNIIHGIGVSNFIPDQLETARAVLDVPIAAHQFECHPLWPQSELRRETVKHGSWIVAYCPVARGAVESHPVITEIADDHDISPAQVSLAWLLEQDRVIPIPSTTDPAHLRENHDAETIELSESAIDRLNAIGPEKRVVDPERAPWNN